MSHLHELEGSLYNRFILEPLWYACFYPRGNSVYSRNRYLVDIVKDQKYDAVKNAIESSNSRELRDPLLLRNILATAFYQQPSDQRDYFIAYMLTLEPINYLTKMLPSDALFRISDGMVSYQSIITEAAGRKDPAIMNLLIERFGIELIVSSNVIEKAIDRNDSPMIRAILQKDHRFSRQEIELIVSLSEKEYSINRNMGAATNHHQTTHDHRDHGDATNMGTALATFTALRAQKDSLWSKIAFLPTYAQHAAKNMSGTACAAFAMAGAYAAYKCRPKI